MAAATVVTNKGKAMFADRVRTTPGTYTAAPKNVAHGTGGGSRTATVTDTLLTTEADSRVAGTESAVTTSVTGDTYQVQGTVSCGATETINEGGLFDTTTAATQNMFTSATFANIAVNSGDSIAYTWKVQLT